MRVGRTSRIVIGVVWLAWCCVDVGRGVREGVSIRLDPLRRH